MKNIIIVLTTLFVAQAYAKTSCESSVTGLEVKEQLEINTDVPKHLIGATICVKQTDGRESCVPAEKFKVVARQQQFIVTKVQQNTETQCTTDTSKANRVSLLVGKGPKNKLDVDSSNAPNEVDVSNRYGTVGGVQYQYKFEDSNWSIPLQLQTNESALIGVGYDF